MLGRQEISIAGETGWEVLRAPGDQIEEESNQGDDFDCPDQIENGIMDTRIEPAKVAPVGERA